MRGFNVMMASLAMCGMSAFSAFAVDQMPPSPDSVCHGAIEDYADDMRVLKWGTVKINVNMERDGALHYGFYGELAGTIKGVRQGGLPLIEGREDMLTQIHSWAMSPSHGMWLVIMPGVGPRLQAQVFVVGDKDGKPKCFTIYKEPIAVDAADLPKNILD